MIFKPSIAKLGLEIKTGMHYFFFFSGCNGKSGFLCEQLPEIVGIVIIADLNSTVPC